MRTQESCSWVAKTTQLHNLSTRALIPRRPNPGLPNQDFWMFDESKIVRMDYTEDGTQLGRELLENVDPAPFIEYKQMAMKHSEPLLEAVARGANRGAAAIDHSRL